MNLDQVKRTLSTQAGGYLRNTLLVGTCQTCRTRIGKGTMCQRCAGFESSPARPDAVGFMTYAGSVPPIEQSEAVMYGYKRPGRLRSDTAYAIVALLTYLGIRGHLQCPGRILDRRLTHWSTVSSLRGRHEPHPLREIVAASNDLVAEIPLVGALPDGGSPRETSADHYTVGRELPVNSHVLLVDDTWVSGAHVRSATWALRTAGATLVSGLSLARWLSVDWDPGVTSWARTSLASNDFDPEMCPWTGSSCP